MTVLSDSEIRIRIAANQLVPGGDPARANECSYSFLPGRAFRAGSQDSPIDFSGATAGERVIVEPGKMIWIRTRDHVKLPSELVGFWWQTNTLSRQGLMLVNMSMIEPGYEGDLACLFVNFGKSPVLVEGHTVIAKMVFVDIRGTVAQPFNRTTPTRDYDTALNKLAIEQPESFLQIGELASALDKTRDDAKNQIERLAATLKDEIRAKAQDLKSDAAADLKKAREDAVADFKKDMPKAIQGSFAWALGLFAVLALASGAVSWMKGELFPNVKEIARSEAEATLRDRTTITEQPNSAQTLLLLHRIDELNQRIATVEKKKP